MSGTGANRESHVTVEEARKHVPEPFGTKCMRCGEEMPCTTRCLWNAEHNPKDAR